jgi:hypothetical protein
MADLELIKMRRPEPAHPGGPVEADVHPAEVESWKLHGWQIDEEAAVQSSAVEAKGPESSRRGRNRKVE